MRAVFKVLLIGEGAVGKTSLLKRATLNTFDENMKMTVGVDFAVRCISQGSWEAALQIWDLGGQERFRDLIIRYFKGVSLAVAVFDVTLRHTLNRLQEWIVTLRNSEGAVPVVVVGNKVDVRSQLPKGGSFVTTEEGRAFAASHQAPYVETSEDGTRSRHTFPRNHKNPAATLPESRDRRAQDLSRLGGRSLNDGHP